ncbi:MAG: hypothetical protein LUC45_06210 [Paraprevotella sp.]|nr:hypothetical protein [Paraprevotella sp.]
MKKTLIRCAAVLLAVTGLVPQAKSDTDILKTEQGYNKITQMPTDLENYYFVIVDKDKNLMMTLGAGVHQGSDRNTWWYKTSVDPTTDLNRLWTIEHNDGVNDQATGYAFRSVADPTLLMQTEWNNGYNFRTNDQPNPCEWTQFLFDYQDGYWTFENGKYPMSSTASYKGYIGPWDEGDDPIKDGEETAANKSGDYIGKYILYAIKKTDFVLLRGGDCTYLIGDICQSTSGWTRSYTSSGGLDNYQIQNSENKNNGDLKSSSYLETWTAGKYSTGKLSYALSDLPSGHYKISAYTFDGNKSGKVNFFADNKEEVKRVTLDSSTDLFTLSTIDDITVNDAGVEIGLEITEDNVVNWTGLTNVQLQYLGGLTDADVLDEARKRLYDKIQTADAIDLEVNVGQEPFQIPETAVDAFDEAYGQATGVYNNVASNVSEVEAAIQALDKAITAYNNAELNAPAEGDRFNVILATKDDYAYANKAVTFCKGSNPTQGNFALNYQAEANANYAQAFTFEKVTANFYLMTFADEDGQTYYVCTGTQWGAGTGDYGIRVTTDRSKALPFKIMVTQKEGEYNLWNTAANQYMGSQDAGFYTVNSHIEFYIRKAEKADVTLTVTDAGWATLILPFPAAVPSDMEVYACNGTSSTEDASTALLTMDKVDAIQANVPYIVKASAGKYEFSDYGLAIQNEYTEGLMTGIYAGKTAVAGTYVLQNQDGKVGFYKVAEGAEPKVDAYRAYMNADVAEANVLALNLPDNDVTGVDDVTTDAGTGPVNVYSIDGVLVRENVRMEDALKGLHKGIYIVNGVKKTVK